MPGMEGKSQLDGVHFIPVEVHNKDGRGDKYFGWDQKIKKRFGIDFNPGQINTSELYVGLIKAWHRHQQQDDFMFFFSGIVIVVVWRTNLGSLCEQYERKYESEKFIVGEHNPGIVCIPREYWHGLHCIKGPGWMNYYVTQEYNPENIDEERLDCYDPGYAEMRKLLEMEVK